MIISRTLLRVSFFGGGTDYPVYFKEHGSSQIIFYDHASRKRDLDLINGHAARVVARTAAEGR